MLDEVRLSFLRWLAIEDQARAAQYVAYREYYDGNHDTQLTKRQRQYLQLKIGTEFNDNYTPIVVDALAERLTVTGFDAEGQDEQLWEWWTLARMDAVQSVTHLAAVRDGDGYVLVEWDNERGGPVFTFEPAFDGMEGLKVHYRKDKRNEIAFASKRWRVESENPSQAGRTRRLNLYYPDRIEKYISTNDAYQGIWQEYVEDGESGWPIPWTAAGEPLGVPVAHFKNRDQGYNYGQSELKNVIPLQNALNKTLIDLLAAADTTGFPLYVMLGDDPAGLTFAPGSVVYSLHPPSGEGAVSVFKLETSDLTPIIGLKDSFVTEIARVSRTPLSYFQTTGARAAEGTLKQEEAGLVARAKDRQTSFGNIWENSLAMARRLHNAFGEGGLDEEQQISTQWADPETRNEEAHLKALESKRRLGVPEERLWIEMGYDAEAIAEMRAQRGEERQQASNVGGELLRSFEGGGFETE